MYLFIFEVFLFLLGLWTLISGRISARLVGAGMGEARGRPVRLAGLLIMLPIIFEYILGNLLRLVGDEYAWVFLGFQMLLVAAVLIVASILIRRSLKAAKQAQARDEIEEVK